MADKKKRTPRLGRGLSSLMAAPAPIQPPQSPATPKPATTPQTAAADPQTPSASESPTTSATPAQPTHGPPNTTQASQGLSHIAISQITPNARQPRQTFQDTAIQSLADSIKAEGVMQPIVVRPAAGGQQGGAAAYELIAGERRWRAAKLAGLDTLPALVRELSDEQAAEWALIENLQREDLNPIEKAQAFQQLAQEFGLSHAQIAQRVGLERSTITNLLRLLALSDFCRGLLSEDLLSMGQARAIAGLPDPAQQKAVAQAAVREGLSVRQVEAQVRRILQGGGQTTTPKAGGAKPVYLADLEKQITEQLGTRVKLKAGRKKGAGTLSIDFYSLDQFDQLMERMKVKTD